jgi:NAD(P)-dependent dehydrogenase (short-subunit alcohol dehydrogenase family)
VDLGGDSGIGRAIAILFAKEGADSFIVYLPEEEEDAQETKKRVESTGRKCHLFPTDVRSPENCEKAVKAALQALGKVNILVWANGLRLYLKRLTE